MKKIILLSSLFIMSLSIASAQVEPSLPPPVPANPGEMPQPPFPNSQPVPNVATNPDKHPEYVQFKELEYNFDTIKQGVPASHVFEFTNVGPRAINLENVSASCGCTTPNWKGGAYNTNQTGQITATYNAAGEGHFTKSITITTSEGMQVLTIKGYVMPAAFYTVWKAEHDARLKAKAEAEAYAKMTKKEKKKYNKQKAKEAKKQKNNKK